MIAEFDIEIANGLLKCTSDNMSEKVVSVFRVSDVKGIDYSPSVLKVIFYKGTIINIQRTSFRSASDGAIQFPYNGDILKLAEKLEKAMSIHKKVWFNGEE